MAPRNYDYPSVEVTKDEENEDELPPSANDLDEPPSEGAKQQEYASTSSTLKIVWRNVILMAALHVVSVYTFLFLTWKCNPRTLLWAVALYMCSALGITAGAHRLWAHRCYKAKLPLRILLAIFNCVAFQNDIFEWSRDHRVHHKHSETDADPHNALRGFFFAHVGWLLCRKHPKVIEKGAIIDLHDLKADPVVYYQRKFYIPLVLLFCFIVPTLVPMYLWGETFLNAFYVCGLLRYCFLLNCTWMVNSAAHMWGFRPYDRSINPAENILVSSLAMGEGWHNYHHTFPWDYKAGEFGWKINPTTLFIDAMAAIGLATNRRVVPKKMIVARRLRTGKTE